MKALVFLLVLANVLFYAFAGGYFGHPGNPDAGRAEQQLAPERVRIVARGPNPPAKGAVEAAQRPAEPEELCLRWDHLAAAEADQLASALAEKFAGVRVERRPASTDGAAWWVLVPAQTSKAEAERKAGELKQLGVSDLFVVQEAGPNQFAISLGVFSSEKGGQEQLAELRAKGVKSAKLIPRPGKEPQFSVEARGPLAKKGEVQEFAEGVVTKSTAQGCK